MMQHRALKNRRSLTPSTGLPATDDVHATRRGGARHDVTAQGHPQEQDRTGARSLGPPPVP